jgi:hypothetical protein
VDFYVDFKEDTSVIEKRNHFCRYNILIFKKSEIKANVNTFQEKYRSLIII